MGKLTQAQLAQRFGELYQFTRVKDKGLSNMLEPTPVACDAEAMTATLRFEKREWEKNHRGELHGGTIAAMFDTAMGMTVIAFADGRGTTTSDLTVSYMSPFMGNRFDFKIEIIKLGRIMVRVRAIGIDADTGKKLASATGNFIFTDVRQAPATV